MTLSVFFFVFFVMVMRGGKIITLCWVMKVKIALTQFCAQPLDSEPLKIGAPLEVSSASHGLLGHSLLQAFTVLMTIS